MIFNSQGDAKLRQYINGQTITPGDTAITLPKGAQLLGGVTLAAVDTEILEVTPTADQQIIIPPAGKYFNQVKVGSAVKEGKCLWRKFPAKVSYVTNPSIYISGSTSNAAVTCSQVDLTKVEADFFDGFMYGNNIASFSYDYITETLYYIHSDGVKYETIWIKEMETLNVVNLGLSFASTWNYTGAKEVIMPSGETIYVVDNDSEKYPAAGLQDGYYFRAL